MSPDPQVEAVRPERAEDYDAVRRVHRGAFGPDAAEADLVEALRASGEHVADLCLVALAGDEVVGHLCFSRARLGSGDDVLALAPLAVLPDWQRRGVGSRLIEEGLRRAAETDLPLVVVLGHPEYYPRFGFERAETYGVTAPWDVPADAWMVLRLPAYRPDARGPVTYPAAFDAVT
jgi:putative acetyltransferase